jgi:hypothetical protein
MGGLGSGARGSQGAGGARGEADDDALMLALLGFADIHA